jgi:Lrp/AsnC family leucine-responsive transcriptional regulator
VNLSPASCVRRVKRLRGEGVIVADVSIVAPEALGRRLMMVVMSKVKFSCKLPVRPA